MRVVGGERGDELAAAVRAEAAGVESRPVSSRTSETTSDRGSLARMPDPPGSSWTNPSGVEAVVRNSRTSTILVSSRVAPGAYSTATAMSGREMTTSLSFTRSSAATCTAAWSAQ